MSDLQGKRQLAEVEGCGLVKEDEEQRGISCAEKVMGDLQGCLALTQRGFCYVEGFGATSGDEW